jgi:hypothetical protein
MKPMKTGTLLLIVLAAVAPQAVNAQHTHGGHAGHQPDSSGMVGAADAVMSAPMSDAAKKHMRLSPTRTGTAEDSARALDLARQLRTSLAKYADTAVAVAEGYRMFMPNVKTQRVYHFTNYRHAFMEAFRFDPEKPTSILYERGADGTLKIVGAMYTAPKRVDAAKLDERIPLSIARWHQHVNWCIPKRGEEKRWLERFEGLPLFGPESPVATRAQCDQVGGRFFPTVFGWMIHANVFAGDNLATIYGHDH